MADRKRIARAAIPFLAIGIAFLVLGAAGRKAFIAIGCAFIVIAILRMARHR